jgi:hypothetical protein
MSGAIQKTGLLLLMYVLWGKEGGKVKFVDKKVGPIEGQ